MSAVVTAIVVAGLALVLAYTVAAGFDALGAALLVACAALGVLGIAVARRARRGAFGPRRCDACGGLVSPNAPYCKHCGRTLPASER